MNPHRSTRTRRGTRLRLTYANVVASLALFIALGGGAYAAVAIPRNSVGATQLKNRAVTPAKVSPATRKLFKGQRGVTGAAGQKGATGPSDIFAAGAAYGLLTSSNITVASVVVPPGSYFIQAKTTIFTNAAGTGAIADCVVKAANVGLDYAEVSLPSYSTHASSEVLSLAGASTFTSATTIELLCQTGAGAAHYDDARVWAIKTGALHGAPLPVD